MWVDSPRAAEQFASAEEFDSRISEFWEVQLQFRAYPLHP
jgi:hypothetical protein